MRLEVLSSGIDYRGHFLAQQSSFTDVVLRSFEMLVDGKLKNLKLQWLVRVYTSFFFVCVYAIASYNHCNKTGPVKTLQAYQCTTGSKAPSTLSVYIAHPSTIFVNFILFLEVLQSTTQRLLHFLSMPMSTTSQAGPYLHCILHLPTSAFFDKNSPTLNH